MKYKKFEFKNLGIVMSAEAHSFDIGAADPGSDPYMTHVTNGGIFAGSTMSQISSVQTIPPSHPMSIDSPQIYRYRSNDSLPGIPSLEQQQQLSQQRPSTMIALAQPCNAAQQETEREIYHYGHSGNLMADQSSINTAKYKVLQAQWYQTAQQPQLEKVSPIGQYLDSKYNIEGALPQVVNAYNSNGGSNSRGGRNNLVGQEVFHKQPQLMTADFIKVESLSSLDQKKPLRVNDSLVTKVKASSNLKSRVQSSLLTSKSQNGRRDKSQSQKQLNTTSRSIGRNNPPQKNLQTYTQKTLRTQKSSGSLESKYVKVKPRSTTPLEKMNRTSTQRQAISRRNNISDGASALFPPLDQSLSSYLNKKNSKDGTFDSSKLIMISKDKSNKVVEGDSRLSSNLNRLFGTNKSKMSTLKTSRNDKKKRQKSSMTPSSTLRRSATSTPLLLRSSRMSSGKLPEISKLRDVIDKESNLLPKMEIIQTATMTARKSHRSRCSACTNSAERLSKHTVTKSNKKSSSNYSNKKTATRNGRSQLTKLRDRHNMLKQHTMNGNGGPQTNIISHNNKTSGLRRNVSRGEKKINSGTYFVTSSFDDQNNTATFKGSRKGSAMLVHSKSTSVGHFSPFVEHQELLHPEEYGANCTEKQIVNILTKQGSRSRRSSSKKKPRGRSQSSCKSSVNSHSLRKSKNSKTSQRQQNVAVFGKNYKRTPVQPLSSYQQEPFVQDGTKNESSISHLNSQKSLTLAGNNGLMMQKRSIRNNYQKQHHSSSLAHTNSQQFIKSNNNMKGTLNIEPAEQTQHYQSYMNTLVRSQSSKLSPTHQHGYNATTGQANMPLPYSSMQKLPNFSQTTNGQENLPAHFRSVGMSDHGHSLISNKETNAYAIPGKANYQRRSGSNSPGLTTKTLSQESHQSNKGAGATLSVRVQPPTKRSVAKATGGDSLSSHTRQHTPTSQLTSRSNKPHDLLSFEKSWNQVIDSLENFQKRRVAVLRNKLAQIVDSNYSNLEGANGILEKSLLAKDDCELERVGNAQQIQNLIKNGFRMDQERVILQLQSELASSDRLKADYSRLKRRYVQRKEDWATQIKNLQTRAQSQRDGLVSELERQVSFYRTQAEDMSMRMRQDLKAKQQECEHAIQGEQGFRQALIQTEVEVQKQQDHISHLNAMLEKSDAEMDRYRQAMDLNRQDTAHMEASLRREAHEAVNQMKTHCKQKYASRLQELDTANTENLQTRLQDIERNLRELHQKDFEAQSEKFELRLKTTYIEISEHEGIVRHVQAKERDSHQSILDELQATREAAIVQLTNDLRDEADTDRLRLEEQIRQFQSQIQDIQVENQRAMEDKDKVWQDIQDTRAQDELQVTRDFIQKENDMRQQIQEGQHQVHVLESEITNFQREQEEKAQQFVAQEEHLLKEIEQLNSKLDESFGIAEQLVESKSHIQNFQQTIRELQDSIQLQRQENVTLQSLVKSKDSHIERDSKDVQQLKKRINWVTQLKQSQIRSLQGELKNLKASFASEFEQFERGFQQQTEPMFSLAKQLQERLVEKNSQLESLSAKFETVLAQLDHSNKAKDQLQSEILERTSERDAARNASQKIQDKAQHESQSQKKQLTRVDRDRSKIDQELAEAKTKAHRLEERVTNLNRIVSQLEEQIKQSSSDYEFLEKERDSDQKQHKEEMADKERKLQEYFCKKLDRKLTRVNDEHTKVIQELKRDHQHQLVLFEQEFQAAQVRIDQLEQQLMQVQGRQQRQRTKDRETKQKKKTQMIEYEVTKSIEKALGRSGSRKIQRNATQPTIGHQQQNVVDPYGVQGLQTPNIMQKQQQMAFSLQQKQNYQQSPDNSRVSAHQFLNYGSGTYGTNDNGQGHGQSLNIYDLQGEHSIRQSAEQNTGYGQRSNYRYQQQRNPSSNSRATTGNAVRSKSSHSVQNLLQATKSLIQQNSNAGNHLNRENYPPTLNNVFSTTQPQKLLVVQQQQQADYQVSQQLYNQQHQEVFNPLLTIKPVALMSQVTASQSNLNRAVGANGANNVSNFEAGTQGGNFSRDAISRSFEAKLLSNGKSNQPNTQEE